MCKIVREFPPLCRECSALLLPPTCTDSVAIAECRRCHEKYACFLPGWLPTADEELIKDYGNNVGALTFEFGHSFWSAVALAREYYNKFTDEAYCRSIGIPTQNDEFFWHEGGGMASRIHYYLVVGSDPDPRRFIDWRTEHNRLKRAERDRLKGL